MIKINHKSDFKIKEKPTTVALEVPFIFSYYVFENKKYVASFDGSEYVNCKRKEDGSLDVIFNNPGFGIGHLKVERKYAINDKAFSDGVYDVVTVDKTDVFITSGNTFETYVETLVVPPYLKGDKGDPMTWSTMTETEREELVHDVAEAIDPEMVMTENEKSRQEAEQSRQTAEQQRSTTFNTLKGEMQSAITAGNAAAGNAQKVVDEYDEKVAEQDSKLSELGYEVQLTLTRTNSKSLFEQKNTSNSIVWKNASECIIDAYAEGSDKLFVYLCSSFGASKRVYINDLNGMISVPSNTNEVKLHEIVINNTKLYLLIDWSKNVNAGGDEGSLEKTKFAEHIYKSVEHPYIVGIIDQSKSATKEDINDLYNSLPELVDNNIKGLYKIYNTEVSEGVGFTQIVEYPQGNDKIYIEVYSDFYSDYKIYYAESQSLSVLDNLINNCVVGEKIVVPKIDGRPYLYLFNARNTPSVQEVKVKVYQSGSVDDRIDTIDGQIQKINSIINKPLNIVCFGDSITEFTYPEDYVNLTGKYKGYVDYLAEYLRCNTYNMGIGGARYAQRVTPMDIPSDINQAYAGLDVVSVVQSWTTQNFTRLENCVQWLIDNNAGDNNSGQLKIIKSISPSEVDVVILFAGANDWFSSQKWGEINSDDSSTTMGAIVNCVKMLLEANPRLRVMIMTPIVRYKSNDRISGNFSDNYEHNGRKLTELVDLIVNQSKLMHIPCCDLYWNLGWNQTNFSSFFLDNDSVHPYKGFKPLAEKIGRFIQSN